MGIKSIALAATLLVTSAGVNAALITNLSNLDINGTNYDVTFHTGAGDSFNALWDANDDGVFGGGGSTFATSPTFWGNASQAQDAASSIIAALGLVDWTIASGISDSFIVPYDANSGSGITSFNDSINVYYDSLNTSNLDTLSLAVANDADVFTNDMPYVSFRVSAVPIPAAVWLFGSGLLGLIGAARRKVRV